MKVLIYFTSDISGSECACLEAFPLSATIYVPNLVRSSTYWPRFNIFYGMLGSLFSKSENSFSVLSRVENCVYSLKCMLI